MDMHVLSALFMNFSRNWNDQLTNKNKAAGIYYVFACELIYDVWGKSKEKRAVVANRALNDRTRLRK